MPSLPYNWRHTPFGANCADPRFFSAPFLSAPLLYAFFLPPSLCVLSALLLYAFFLSSFSLPFLSTFLLSVLPLSVLFHPVSSLQILSLSISSAPSTHPSHPSRTIFPSRSSTGQPQPSRQGKEEERELPLYPSQHHISDPCDTAQG